MQNFKDLAEFEVTWHAFQLNPGAPGGPGVPKWDMINSKVSFWMRPLVRPFFWYLGYRDGIRFELNGNTGNTFDSHRLISLAQKQGLQNELVEELFHQYFEQGQCISEHKVLYAAAEKVGVVDAREVLESSAEVSEVHKDLQEYQGRQGIRGVPYFIIENKYNESGAIGSAAFEKIFHEVIARTQ